MKLQDSIDLLREIMSFGSWGGVGGAHSYPGPEPGKVGALSPGHTWPFKSPEVPEKLRRLPGQQRELQKKVRQWRARER